MKNMRPGQNLWNRWKKKLFELYQDPELNEKPELLSQRGGAHYSDSACNLIHSIYNDKGDIQVVNTVNRGAIKKISRTRRSWK